MGELSAIAWTRSTFNPWIGCTKVGPGCDNCYAENLDSRKRWGGITHWGPGVARHRTSASNWKQPLAWNRKAAESGEPWRVFCASLADVFDNEAPDQWRVDLWSLVSQTPALTWLLLTKRIGLAPKAWPPNVWIGATIVNQEEWDRDRNKLLDISASVRFVSYEPAIGPIDFGQQMPEWVIVGGESGSKARMFNVEWARSTIKQCRDAGVACFVKQMGAATYGLGNGKWTDRAGADPNEWPADLRVQEFPCHLPVQSVEPPSIATAK
jgi:protein gp37